MTIGRILCRVILGAAFLPGWVSAQTVITPQAFLDAVVGKTLEFHEIRSGELVGTEQFLNRTVSVWREEGRGCVYGQITTPNGQICFLYDNDPDGVPVCWWPFLHEDRLLVRLASLSDGEIQEVRSITEDSLNCPSTPIS
ncbi:hypothetical protein HW561_02135 [Rhodobacteraceae bacterium B1Z28]|uniref:Uncharacterized protein n=1 Tax=Ruegeria haliotis TaxID=2747601 RepID=A0ABX2PLJ8_9RHOB|nr:hypothetical protein [Ruegeria haliotis]NVO54586.1 hypothetical protein [Ruegeria haliotis]